MRGSRFALALGLPALACWLVAPARLSAESVTVGPSKDNTLYESSTGALSDGAGEYFYVGRTNQFSASIRRGLIAFDLGAAEIPRGARVLSARLVLHMTRSSSASPQPTALHRLLADWGEGNSNAGERGGDGAPATPGDATWVHRFFNDREWSARGGDFAPSASATAEVGGPGEYVWTGPALAADVESWLRDPSGNFGWLLLGNEEIAASSKRFDSRQRDDPPTRPRLEIEFSPPVPSPALSPWALWATAGLLVALGMSLLARKRAPSVAA